MNIRHRRLRQNSAIRALVQENQLSVDDFLVPLFVVEGNGVREEISSMPNYYRMSLDELQKEVIELWELGLKAVLIFVKVPDELKDNEGKEALNPKGLMPNAIKAIKEVCPEMLVFTDVALDPYSSYGHDGVVKEGQIVNDETVEILSKISVIHAKAGADFVAPSDMMDGRIEAVRKALEKANFPNVGIMSYSAKYASAFYGPFRDALDSAPGFGDKKTYQMNPANANEAVKEIIDDTKEGADIIMVKPGLPYLDIVVLAKQKTTLPIAIYQVSGEYAMIKAAAEKGWLNEKEAMLESLISMKRAGADIIASYFAKEVALLLK
ncbi:MAG TPA: porphobilinogen synthase [Crocinitomix sp.]|nr:porphobilinogen synthase [Crocinitomix sp.]